MIKIFLSHATRDRELANQLKEEIIKALGFEENDIFLSSREKTIKKGDWQKAIEKALNEAEVIIPLITPCGAKSTWVSFEYGCFWAKAEQALKHHVCKVYPLHSPKVGIPSPLNKYESKDLTSISALEVYFETLCNHFKITYSQKANLDAIIEKAWKTPLLTAEETKLQMEAKLFLRQAKTRDEKQDVIEWMNEMNILQKANLVGMDLQYTEFKQANLYKTNFGNSDLRGVSFWGSNLEEAILGSTKLQGAIFQEVTSLKGASFQGASLDEKTILPDRKLYDPQQGLIQLEQWEAIVDH